MCSVFLESGYSSGNHYSGTKKSLLELTGKVKIYALSELYRIYEQELECVNRNMVVGIFKGEEENKLENMGIELTPKSFVELRKAEKKLV